MRNFVCLVLLGTAFAISGPNDRQITDPKSVTAQQNANAKPLPVEDLFFTRQIYDAAWSPDGKEIELSTTLTGRANLWKVAATGSWPIQIAQSDDRQQGGQWSPDSKWIAFAQDKGGNELWDVYLTASNGSQLTDITEVQGPTMISSENGLLRGTVLLNVRGRDVGSFVDEAKAAIARQVQMPTGYYVEWSGEYENQQRARSRLLLVVPIVLIVIFALLYITYHSALEAAHVLMAVPFALTGGIYLLWILNYNFSVAVWVGFIALFGTAVQTAVVMVIYLEEAVERKKSEVGQLTRASLIEAVTEGALLRLRPKLMTVSTVVASLLPIMWSTSAGAEVMKPLATPVLGGMVSSLLHVLIVTPVIFFWLRERELKKESAAAEN